MAWRSAGSYLSRGFSFYLVTNLLFLVLVDGNFTSWENVGNCSQSCGGGRQYQRRNCTNPAPAYGGNNCTGNTSRTISCNSHACSGIQTKEFLLLLCTEILQFASKLSTLCLVSFICFGLLCKSFVSVL